MMSINESEVLAQANQKSSEIVLSINGISKKFCRDLKRSLFYGVQDITTELVGLREKSNKLRPKEFWALNNVSLQLRRGEAVGLLGKNGSGKSTLLRIIAGLIKPDTGFVEVNGRVAPLIALGAGFNPILTGRENIYANMSILGLTTKEIKEQFDEVVDFAEIGDAIDTPVQSYSSGMAARLGFACAIHTQPDILLIDEVLAVGDMRFRVKCYRRLAELARKGVSFVLVSHDSNTILATCSSAIFLASGKVVDTGDTPRIMRKYEESLFSNQVQQCAGKLSLPEKSKDESLGIDITYLCFKDKEFKLIESPISGNAIYFCIGLKSHKDIKNVSLNILVSELSTENQRVLRFSTYDDHESFDILPGKHELQLRMPYCGLKPGLYTIKMSVNQQGSLYLFDAVESFNFTVKNSGNMSDCFFYQPRQWVLTNNEGLEI